DPDLVVAPIKIERLASGFNRREADLRGALKNTDPVGPGKSGTPPAANQSGNPPANTPGAAKPSPEASAPPEKHDTRSSVATGELGGSDDEQLTQALDMLRGLALVASRNTR